MEKFLLCALATVFVVSTAGALKNISIGAIFHEENSETELAFKYAVSRFNLFNVEYHVVPMTHVVSETDAFKTGQIACEMAEHGVAALFGPDSVKTNEIVQSVSETLEIPQFQTFWNPKLGSFSDPAAPIDKPIQSFNLYPESQLLSMALATLLREMRWKSYTIIYENDDGLVRLQEVLKTHKEDDSPVTVKKLLPGPDHRSLLKEIKASSESQIILDCDADLILNILEQADEVNLMEEYHSYILTSLDSHTLDFSRFKLKRTNITSLRLVDPNTSHIRNVVRDWEVGELNQDRRIRPVPDSVRVRGNHRIKLGNNVSRRIINNLCDINRYLSRNTERPFSIRL